MRVRLGDVCDRGTSNLKQSDITDTSGEYPVYGASGLIGTVSFYHQKLPYVAVVKDGAGIGRTTLHPAESSVIGTMQYLLPKANILPEYLYYVVKHMHLEKYYTGATIPHIYLKDYKSEEFNLEPLEKQHIIVDMIEKIESVIEARQKELKRLDDLIKSRFVEMFGDMILNHNGWERVMLGMVCDVRDGTHDSPKYYMEGYPLVTSKNVTGGRIDFTDCSLICEEDYNKINQRSKVDVGDILMPMIGTVGNPVIVDIDAEFAIKNVALIKFREDAKVVNIFVKALLKSDYFDATVLSKVRGGTQKFISLGDIRKLELFLPPIGLQNQFADFVNQIDKSKLLEWINLAKKSFDLLHERICIW